MNDDNGHVFSKKSNTNKKSNSIAKATASPAYFNHYLRPFNDAEYYYDDSYLYEEATVINMKKFDEKDINKENYLNAGKQYASNVYFNLTCIATMCISAVFIFKKI